MNTGRKRQVDEGIERETSKAPRLGMTQEMRTLSRGMKPGERFPHPCERCSSLGYNCVKGEGKRSTACRHCEGRHQSCIWSEDQAIAERATSLVTDAQASETSVECEPWVTVMVEHLQKNRGVLRSQTAQLKRIAENMDVLVEIREDELKEHERTNEIFEAMAHMMSQYVGVPSGLSARPARQEEEEEEAEDSNAMEEDHMEEEELNVTAGGENASMANEKDGREKRVTAVKEQIEILYQMNCLEDE